ncbi:MAG: polysaccharide deacetylase family protein [Hyphomicrobiaceae bacterium]|nr:polysaccharide deacetylase family protein [Hyphomicrobiaceae bacterium]
MWWRTRLLIGAGLLCHALAGPAWAATCEGNPKALGVSRVVEIDTTGGPAFGFNQYKVHDFLEPGEIILTFDDGPQRIHTEAILDALKHHCTRATFFSIGKMALGYPEIIRRVLKEGHTVGTHTWSHRNLASRKQKGRAIAEIEEGISAVSRAVGRGVSPFFRYPFLRDSKETLAHLQKRNVSTFSADLDSFDFKYRSPARLVSTLMARLKKKGKGIILMHDIQPVTSKALPRLLQELQAAGFKVVHLTTSTPLKTLPQYDKAIEKHVRGLPAAGTARPTSSVVKTIKRY